jgi:hypothetical protein
MFASKVSTAGLGPSWRLGIRPETLLLKKSEVDEKVGRVMNENVKSRANEYSRPSLFDPE